MALNGLSLIINGNLFQTVVPYLATSFAASCLPLISNSRSSHAADYYFDLTSNPSKHAFIFAFIGADETFMDAFNSTFTIMEPTPIQSNFEALCAYSFHPATSPFGSRCGT